MKSPQMSVCFALFLVCLSLVSAVTLQEDEFASLKSGAYSRLKTSLSRGDEFRDMLKLENRGDIYYRCNPPKGKNYIALTFDDGPNEVPIKEDRTESADPFWQRLKKSTTGRNMHSAILAGLKKADVKATFFFVGQQMKQHQADVQQTVKDGHEIGNHSWSHVHVKKASFEDSKEEIKKCNKEIRKATGKDSFLYRDPYGESTKKIDAYLKDRNMKSIYWNVDCKDWAGKDDQKECFDYVLRNSKGDKWPNPIVLLHNWAPITAYRIAEYVEKLKSLAPEGVEFVTMSKCIGQDSDGDITAVAKDRAEAKRLAAAKALKGKKGKQMQKKVKKVKKENKEALTKISKAGKKKRKMSDKQINDNYDYHGNQHHLNKHPLSKKLMEKRMAKAATKAKTKAQL